MRVEATGLLRLPIGDVVDVEVPILAGRVDVEVVEEGDCDATLAGGQAGADLVVPGVLAREFYRREDGAVHAEIELRELAPGGVAGGRDVEDVDGGFGDLDRGLEGR